MGRFSGNEISSSPGLKTPQKLAHGLLKYYFFLLFFFSEDNVNVCMGKEWYRFPSNFFLPSNNWNVKFIKSEFKGQLPQPYLTEKAHATAIERPNFNDLNLEELDRFVKVKCPVCLCYEIGGKK